MIAFVDFEASSLNASSYPIEVGWIREDGSGEAYLIRPEADWTDWSCEAYELHGISREKLLAEGLTAACVARRVSSVLSEHDLFSDAPAQDTYWLTVLLDTANLPTMRLRDSYEAFAAACRPLTRRFHASLVTPLAQSIIATAENDAEVATERRHRAGDDAQRLWDTWRRIRERVAEVMS